MNPPDCPVQNILLLTFLIFLSLAQHSATSTNNSPMEREKPEELHRLVHSLTVYEYRRVMEYCRMFNKAGNQHHVHMLRFLREMEVWEHQTLLDEFKGKQVSRIKNYAFNVIFEALRIAHVNTDSDIEEILSAIDIALQKSSWFQAEFRIRDAKRIVVKRELFEHHIRLLKLERIWIQETKTGEGKFNLLAKNWEEKEAQVGLQQNLDRYLQLKARYYDPAKYALLEKGQIDADIVASLPKEGLLKEESYAQSKRAKVQFHSLWTIYYYLTGNKEKELETSLTEYELYQGEENDWVISAHTVRYGNLLRRLSLYYCRQKDRKNSREFLDQLRSFEKRQEGTNLQLIADIIITSANFAIQFGDLDIGKEAGSLLAKHETEFERQKKKKQLIFAQYYLLVLFFQFGETKRAKQFIHDLLDNPKENTRIPVLVYARILHLILLFEERDFDGLEYHGRNYSRFFNKQAPQFHFSKPLVRFFMNAGRYIENDQVQIQLKKMKGELEQYRKTKDSINYNSYFNIDGWLENLKNL